MTIVLANGCFDLLHTGHVRMLQWARRQGDYLIAGVNSDESVRAIKGADRPIYTYEQRKDMLVELRCVDMVCAFGGDVDDLIERLVADGLKPNLLVKGAEYQWKKVPGMDAIVTLGGKVLFAPMVEGVSTTAVLERIGSDFYNDGLERGLW